MRRAAPYLLFGAITLVCFWRFLFLGWTLYDVRTLQDYHGTRPAEERGWFASNRPHVDRGDTILALPMLHRLYNEGLHRGELRLWNPYLFCGYPVYNDTALHPFYPPHVLLHATLPPRIAYDLGVMIHFFLAGAAFYWLLRGMGRSDVASTAGGVIWMLNGYNALWVSSNIPAGASVFAPLALLGLHLGLQRRELRPFALAGLAMGLAILGSHGQHILHLLIFLSLWLFVSWIRDRDARPQILRGSFLFVAVAMGVGMAAILTRLDSMTNGVRVPGADAEMHYGVPWRLPTYIAGMAIGRMCAPPTWLLRSEFTIHIGVLATALAIGGAVRGFRDPWVRFVSIFAASALLVAFIKPLAELLLMIPFLNNSMPARWVYVFAFCAAILAAEGLDALRADPVKTGRLMLGVAGASLILVGLYSPHGAVAETLAGLALAVAAVLTARRPQWSLPLCFAALLVDLLPDVLVFNRHADPAPLATAIERPNDKEPWRATGSLRLAGGPAPANLWTLATGNNVLALHGVEAVMGYESIAPTTAVQYCVATSGGKSVAGSGRVLAVARLDSPLLGIANVKYVYWPFDLDLESRFTRRWTRGPLTLYENPNALPRACLVPRGVRAADEGEAAKLLSELDARSTVVLLDEVPPTAEGGGTVSWTTRETDRIELAVDAKADSILVVSDTDYPGWEAEVDGKETPILNANLAFRAIAVPAGKHKVTMRFRPSSARFGLIVTGLSIAAAAAFALRRKTSASVPTGAILQS